jgi:aspartate beta-hydroxylase
MPAAPPPIDVERLDKSAFSDLTPAVIDDRPLPPAERLALVKSLIAERRLPRSTNPRRNPHFFYPGLPGGAIYDVRDFPWVETVKARVAAITSELRGLEHHRHGKRAFHTVWPDYTGAGEWAVLWLRLYGEPYDDNASLTPDTLAAIDAVPGGCGLLGFSAMAPHTHIRPHCGVTNAKLRCHLALDLVAGQSRIRVDDQLYRWQAGEMFIFDDSFEHEVWNDSDARRVILLFDIFHPDLTEDETTFLLWLESQTAKQTYNALMDDYRARSTDVAWAYRSASPLATPDATAAGAPPAPRGGAGR